MDCEPCWGYWQFSMERLCGLLIPLVHFKLHLYKNLTNNIFLTERFNHLVFVFPSLSNKLSESPTISYSEDKVFSLDSQIEEFYQPKKNYSLNVYEIKRLKSFYLELFNIPKQILEVELRILTRSSGTRPDPTRNIGSGQANYLTQPDLKILIKIFKILYLDEYCSDRDVITTIRFVSLRGIQ